MTDCCGIEITSWRDFFAFFENHLEQAWINDPAVDPMEDPA